MPAPVVHVLTQGNLANQMVQLVVARRIADAVPGCRISNVHLAQWGIEHPALPSTGGAEVLVEGQYVDVDGLARVLRDGTVERVNLLAFGQWMGNFPSRQVVAGLFPPDPRFPGYPGDCLVCNIRGGEVLDGRHPDYTLLPPEFYATLQADTGMRLVFMGQLADNPYCRRLRSRFTDALFRESQGAIADFQTFRNSANLVLSVSTFSWLAAWLSDAQRIVLPVTGLFHPVQVPEVDLLPLDDARYDWHLFPINYSTPVEQFEMAHRAIDGRWRRMTPGAIAALRPATARRLSIAEVLPLFDEDFYVQTYADIAQAVARGDLPSGRAHFVSNGFAERRHAFAFDRRWYATRYPMAAFEVGQGDFASLVQHYCVIGSLRGYRPTPDGPRTASAEDRPSHARLQRDLVA